MTARPDIDVQPPPRALPATPPDLPTRDVPCAQCTNGLCADCQQHIRRQSAAIRERQGHTCTTPEARWCPVHGGCACPVITYGGVLRTRTLSCALHGDDNEHYAGWLAEHVRRGGGL